MYLHRLIRSYSTSPGRRVGRGTLIRSPPTLGTFPGGHRCAFSLGGLLLLGGSHMSIEGETFPTTLLVREGLQPCPSLQGTPPADKDILTVSVSGCWVCGPSAEVAWVLHGSLVLTGAGPFDSEASVKPALLSMLLPLGFGASTAPNDPKLHFPTGKQRRGTSFTATPLNHEQGAANCPSNDFFSVHPS